MTVPCTNGLYSCNLPSVADLKSKLISNDVMNQKVHWHNKRIHSNLSDVRCPEIFIKKCMAELRKIADYLILKSLFVSDVGLFQGKMGIVVALYAYANRHDDKLLEEYAWDLLQQIYDGVHADMPVGLEYGLAGIGYGTTLLQMHGFVDCDLNDILADIDAKIMERDPRRMTDMSVRSGAAGIQLYISMRQRACSKVLTFDDLYVSDLQAALAVRAVAATDIDVISLLNRPTFDIEDYLEKPIGIDGGSAYYILEELPV